MSIDRRKLSNVKVLDALTLYMLPPKFWRRHIDTVNGTSMEESQVYVKRLIQLGYVRYTRVKDGNNGKQYEMTERGREIAKTFGDILYENQ